MAGRRIADRWRRLKAQIRSVYSRGEENLRSLQIRASGETTVQVLMYHSISQEAHRNWGPWRYAVTPQRFEAQIRRLDEKSTIIPLQALIDPERSLPNHVSVVTFDDGYRDTLTEAVPILRRYDAPATVYVSTGLLGTPGPYEYQLASGLLDADSITVTVDGAQISMYLESTADRARAYQEIRRPLKTASPKERRRVTEKVGWVPERCPGMLDDRELRDLASESLVTVGGHGHEHRPLSTLSPQALDSNLSICKHHLDQLLDDPVVDFSYPYGDVSPTVIDAVKKTGFRSATTTEPGPVSASTAMAEPHGIPRLDGASR